MSTNDIRGGAARAAFRLHDGLRRFGHESSMIVSEHSSNDPDVKTFEAPANWMGLLRPPDSAVEKSAGHFGIFFDPAGRL
jgi:hypothetical protein